jgi:hypothetical protein
MRHYKTILIPLVIVAATGCSSTMGKSWGVAPEEGRIEIAADRAGMEAWSDMLNSLVTNSKASPDVVDTPAWQLRREAIRARHQRLAPTPNSQQKGGK